MKEKAEAAAGDAKPIATENSDVAVQPQPITDPAVIKAREGTMSMVSGSSRTRKTPVLAQISGVNLVQTRLTQESIDKAFPEQDDSHKMVPRGRIMDRQKSRVVHDDS